MDILLVPLLRLLIVIVNCAIWLVIASAVLSWLVNFDLINRNNHVVGRIGYVLFQLTEPVFRRLRRFIPRLGGVDLAPLAAIFILYFFKLLAYQVLISL